MSSKDKQLYAVFEVKDKTKKFLGCTKAKSQAQAVAFIGRRFGLWTGLCAELATPELLKNLKKSKARPKVKWQVYDNDGTEVGRQTSAVSAKEANSHVWCGLVKPDKKPPTEEDKARLRQMTAKPVFGQENPWRPRSRCKSSPASQGKFFPH